MNWSFFYNNYLFLGKPSLGFINYQKNSLKLLVKNSGNANLFSIVKNINSQIDYWISNCNFLDFYWDLSNEMDLFLYKILWSWAKKRHPRRSNTWIYSKYWKYLFGRWRFLIRDIIKGNVFLVKSHLFYKSHIFRIPNSISIFDINDKGKISDVWFKKIRKNFKGICAVLYNNQKGICLVCNRLIFLNSANEFKILRLSDKFRSRDVPLSNLTLVHNYCVL